jgi:hypothetical protein
MSQNLPWINPEKYNLVETEKNTFCHQVFIGVFDIEEMMSVVRKVFQDDEINQQYNDYKVKSVLKYLHLPRIRFSHSR